MRADGERIAALVFVMHRESPHYEGCLTAEEPAEILATARGFAGSCADYLFNAVRAPPTVMATTGPARMGQYLSLEGIDPPVWGNHGGHRGDAGQAAIEYTLIVGSG